MDRSKKRLLGLFGYPVAHSKSPLMHNFALNKLGFNWDYHAFAIKPEHIADAVKAIRVLNMVGVNVTIPHKERIIPFLDEVDESAQFIGAVNTIVNENGKLIGYNTDGSGYIQSLVSECNLDISSQRVLVIGAGGAARAIVYSLLKAGVQEITITNRSQERATTIITDFQAVGSVNYSSSILQVIDNVDLIINTTSLGMYPDITEVALDVEFIHDKLLVSDVVYNPLQTKLLEMAASKGARVHSGLGMFVQQGAIAFELWTGVKPPVSEMYNLVLDHL